ncbi:MAG: hypothetical protein VZR95_05705 [Alphaproteobacteria bacterium]
MKKTFVIVALVTILSGCCIFGGGKNTNQQCNFDSVVCTENLQAFYKGIEKFNAKGGAYIIKDMDTGETLENTSINFDVDTVYEVYFSKLDFEKKTTPQRLLNKYMNIVKTSGKGLHQKLRDNVIGGTGSTGRKANVENAEVSGITATSPKKDETVVITTFLGHFKHNGKNYAFVFVMDEPKGLKQTYGWQSAGWNIVPTAGSIIENIAK